MSESDLSLPGSLYNRGNTRDWSVISCLVLICSLIPATYAAESNAIAQQLDIAKAAIEQFDEMATQCLQVSAAGVIDTQQNACQQFRSALDGELLINYINACTNARQWRDNYVVQKIENPNNIEENQQQNLELLINVDYFCTENALVNRTTAVKQAYSSITSAETIPSRQTLSSLVQSIDASNQRRSLNTERQRLLQSLESQSLRQRRETNRQLNELELELIRPANPLDFPSR